MTGDTAGPGSAPGPAGPAAAWVSCGRCQAVVYGKRLARSNGVCPQCGHCRPLTAADRLALLADPGSVEPLDLVADAADPLRLRRRQALPAADRRGPARDRPGRGGASAARLRIDGTPAVAAVMDFRFMGGSLGGAVGELITWPPRRRWRERLPLLLVTASGGVRMQEGVIGLMQMAKTAQALHQLDEAGLPTVCLITDPTYGGVAASFAMLGDVILAEPGARLGFAGPRVIAQTIGQELPAGFQTAEFLLERGFIDQICPRPALRAPARPAAGASAPAATAAPHRAGRGGAPTVVRDPALLPERPAWEAVRRARDIGRPTTSDYLRMILDDFEELHGDRVGGDCPAIIGGVGRLGGDAARRDRPREGPHRRELAAPQLRHAGARPATARPAG